MSKKRLTELSDLNWREAQERAKKVNTAVIPIGATEQHGPHLPIGTDSYIIKGLLNELQKELGDDYPVFFLPLLSIGKSIEHMDFFGTISLSPGTIIAVIEDICSCLQKHGFKKVIFLNGHGGNLDLLKAISFDIRQKYDLMAFTVHAGAGEGWNDPAFWAEVFEGMRAPDCHAGSMETSLIAYLYPELVGEIEPYSVKKAMPDYPFGWKTNELSFNGVIGDPEFYSAEAGKKAMEREVKYLHKLFDEIIAF